MRQRRRRRDLTNQMVADEPEQNMFDMPPTPTLGKLPSHTTGSDSYY